MNAYVRSLTGILTVGVCGFAGFGLWHSQPIISGLFGLMAGYRSIMIVREWPSSED